MSIEAESHVLARLHTFSNHVIVCCFGQIVCFGFGDGGFANAVEELAFCGRDSRTRNVHQSVAYKMLPYSIANFARKTEERRLGRILLDAECRWLALEALVVVGSGSLHVFGTLAFWSSESLGEFGVMRKLGLLRLLHRNVGFALARRHRRS